MASLADFQINTQYAECSCLHIQKGYGGQTLLSGTFHCLLDVQNFKFLAFSQPQFLS